MIEGLDRSAPGIRITQLPDENASDGIPLDLDGRVIAFTFEDSERKADKVILQLDNFDLTLFEHADLISGAVLQVSWGYPNKMAPPRRVVLKKLRGFTRLTLEGKALSALMNREVRTRHWESTTRSKVVEEIAEEHGFDVDFLHVQETNEVHEIINQVAETDARFLRRLAAREEYEYWVDHTGLHWHERKQDSAPIRVLTYYTDPARGEIISINVESNLARRTGKVTVKGRDPSNKSTIEEAASNKTVERATLGEIIEVVDPETGKTSLERRNATSSVRASSAASSEKARREADARFRRGERATLKITAQVVGDPTLCAKSVIELRGVPSLLAGKYYVNEVKHTISTSGYVCELRMTRDGTGRASSRPGRDQGGEKNKHEPIEGSKLSPIEVVDPVTGETHLEYQ